ncbi:MAG TPA: TPM domain-containing protein [Terracidiphilus sp.]
MNSSYRTIAKGLRLTIVATLLFTAALLRAERVEDLPKPTDYVSDYAHVLTPDAIARIDQLCKQLDTQANAQVAVVTVHTIGDEDRDQYVNRLYHQMGIGKKGSDRGLLIFLSVNDHQRRIEVGYGLEGILNDAKVGDIGREMVPYLRQNNFDAAVMTAAKEVGQVIAGDAKVTLQDSGDDWQLPQPQQQQQQRRARHGNPLGGFILLIILLVVFGGGWIFRLLFGWGLLSALFGGGRGWGGGGWGGGSWGSGGGWGGGGGGGGFGGFGGGDSGGGGAGGSW